MPSEQQSELLFRLLVESVREYAIFMLDPTGHIATWNAGAERIKGYAANEIIGKHFSTFYPPEDAGTGKCEMELLVAERDGMFEEEGWRLRKDGSRFWASVVLTAVRNARGHLVGFAKVTRDLTERKHAEEERAARYAAEQASRAKDEFLAMLGHELRNPLAPIVTALQLMKLRNNGNSTREMEVIERQVEHMIHLVDDMLDVSRITKGKLELKKRLIDIRQVVAKAIEIASPLLERGQLHFDLDAPSREILVLGDEARLTQVFSNLLVNAAKYTEVGGHIGVTVRTVNTQVDVQVADDGVGIEPNLLPRVFELFVQGYQKSDRPTGGLGIGLTLVRTLVQMHDGSVEAHSPGVGHGSTFTVHLPIAQAPVIESKPHANARPKRTASPRRILIVDDNDDARLLLAEALEDIGHDVRSAADAAAALEVIKEWRPELAILDIGLPVMDGYELAARLRSELAANTPRMFALTGYGQANDREKSLQAGFVEHFVKPVDLQMLLATIAN